MKNKLSVRKETVGKVGKSSHDLMRASIIFKPFPHCSLSF